MRYFCILDVLINECEIIFDEGELMVIILVVQEDGIGSEFELRVEKLAHSYNLSLVKMGLL